MPEPASQRTVTVANSAGLHLRAAALVVATAGKFKARVMIAKGSQAVEATDVLQLMTLGASLGDKLSLQGGGSDAEAAVAAIEQLFLRKFDEE